MKSVNLVVFFSACTFLSLLLLVAAPAHSATTTTMCSSQSTNAVFTVATYDKFDDAFGELNKLSNFFGVAPAAFTVNMSTTAPRGYCPGSGGANDCYNFTVIVNPDAAIAKSTNIANYTRVGLEAMLAFMFRNATSPNDDPDTLDALNWDFVVITTPSCATQNAASVLSGRNAPSSSSQQQQNYKCPPKFAVKNTARALPNDMCCDTLSPSYIARAFSQAAGGSNFTYLPVDAQFLPPQTVCCFVPLQPAVAVALRTSSAAVTSSTVNALVERSATSMVSPAFSFAVQDAPIAKDGAVANGCSQSLWQSQQTTTSAELPPFALVVPFQCSSGSNAGSSSSLPFYQDALNVSTTLLMKYSSVFSYSPSSNNNNNNNNNQQKMIVNWTTATNRQCGIVLFATRSGVNNNDINASLTKILGCASQWSSSNKGGYVPPFKKKVTPPLMLISLIVTAVLYMLVMTYIYKFKPTSRRYEFQKPENLAEAMLENDQEMLDEATRDVRSHADTAAGAQHHAHFTANKKAVIMTPREKETTEGISQM